MRIAIANTKGGAGKTTTAVHLGVLLAERGRTLLVDADPKPSLTAWSQVALAAGAAFPVTMGRATTDIHRWVVAASEGYEFVIIDCPPEHDDITTSGALAADRILIPVAPTPIELNQLRPTLELLANVVYPGEPADVRALLVRTRTGTRSRANARRLLDRFGIGLLEAEVPLWESYSQSFGTTPNGTTGNHYRAVLAELDAL